MNSNNKTEETFRVRAYGFGELAQLYFPNIMKRSASATLKNWIKENQELHESLNNLGFYPGKRILSPKMVYEIIVKFGIP